MTFRPVRAVIFGKTYPEPSTRYYETVCTAALREEDGRPIRLYPVPLRYLNDEKQYKLWDVVEVPVDRSAKDQRPESYRIDHTKLKTVGHLETDKHGWVARRALLERNTEWHYEGMAELKEANQRRKASIGLVVPGAIERVQLSAKPPEARAEFDQKCAELRLRKESDMFDPEYHALDFLPNEIFLHWSCRVHCVTCSRQPHRMKVLDWGLMQLARRRGWGAATQHLEDLSNALTRDFRLFLGNFAQHPTNFGVIALWYPKLPEQPSLL